MGTLYLVSTPIGNLGDLSTRASETLTNVSRILAEDTRHTGILLKRLGIGTPLISLHAHNETSRTREVLEWLAGGEDLALVSDAGTPLVSDPGQTVVKRVIEGGHRVVPIPGPSAALAALVGSGFGGDRFSFFGFLPRKGPERAELLERLADCPEPVVLYESPERILSLLDALTDVCEDQREVSVGRELTKLHEEFVRGTLAEVRAHFEAHRPRGEFAVVVSGTSRPAGNENVDEPAIRALASALLDGGQSASRAAKEVARRLKLPKNLTYAVVQRLAAEKREGGREGDPVGADENQVSGQEDPPGGKDAR
jgi:16S rRNA (cytidine1402-2'-O)-methyltransferase